MNKHERFIELLEKLENKIDELKYIEETIEATKEETLKESENNDM